MSRLLYYNLIIKIMNCRNFVLAVLFIALSTSTFAQSNLLNAKKPEEIGLKSEAQLQKDNDKPLEYGYVDDRDILMSKKTWELVDLDERINFSLYYPIDTNSIGNERRSLYDVLVKGIKTGKITEVYSDSYFREKRTLKDIQSSLTKIDTSDAGREQYNAGEKISEEFVIRTDLASIDVTDYKIVGLWYFDKRQSDLRYRILGICPVVPDVYTMGKEEAEKDYVELFWVFYPGAREVLHEAKAFNDKNSSMPISFDHLLNSRRFNASVYKEENVYNDREIGEYMKDNALMQLLESDRVKDKVRNFEQDMWNY
jgi:gliding motility associated protien GldN